MASPLLPGDHQIMRKLAEELLPWMICGKMVKRQWFVRLNTFNAYAGDAAAALAGMGIGAPIISAFQGNVPAGQNAIEILRSTLPSGWFVVGLVALIAWFAVRLVVQREDVVARCEPYLPKNTQATSMHYISVSSRRSPAQRLCRIY